MPPTATFTMTAEHLARTLEGARARERSKIIRLIQDRAAVLLGEGNMASLELDVVVESIESMSVARLQVLATEHGIGVGEVAAPPALAIVGGGEVDPLTTDIDAQVAAQEAESGDALPPVRHHDDIDEGEDMIRRRGAVGTPAGFTRD